MILHIFKLNNFLIEFKIQNMINIILYLYYTIYCIQLHILYTYIFTNILCVLCWHPLNYKLYTLM